MTSFTVIASGPRSGTRIAYATAGRAWRPALVLTHSLGSDHHLWDAQITALKSQYFVVAVDHIGHGESDVARGDYSIDQLAGAVLAAADAAEIERFHFCGISVGGLTGQWIALHQPHRLVSLTLSNTAAKIGLEDVWNERIDVARSKGMTALVDGVTARWFSPDFAAANPEQYERSRSTLLATDPDGYAGVCAAIRDADFRSQVASIDVPTLIISGSNDLATTVEQGRWLHEQIRGSKFVELAAAHLGNLDRAEEFTATLDSFLAATTP